MLKADDAEQYSRRECLILHGCKAQEIPDANKSYVSFQNFTLDLLNKHLKLDIKPIEINTMHVLPKASSDKQPIIIKFVRRTVRDLVFYRKKALAGTSMALT